MSLVGGGFIHGKYCAYTNLLVAIQLLLFLSRSFALSILSSVSDALMTRAPHTIISTNKIADSKCLNHWGANSHWQSNSNQNKCTPDWNVNIKDFCVWILSTCNFLFHCNRTIIALWKLDFIDIRCSYFR